MKTHNIVRLTAIISLIFFTGYNALFPGVINNELLVVVSSALAGIAGLSSPMPQILTTPIKKPRCQYEDICREREFIEIKKSFDTSDMKTEKIQA